MRDMKASQNNQVINRKIVIDSENLYVIPVTRVQ